MITGAYNVIIKLEHVTGKDVALHIGFLILSNFLASLLNQLLWVGNTCTVLVPVDVSVQNFTEATTEVVYRSKSELFTPKTVQLCSLSSSSCV